MFKNVYIILLILCSKVVGWNSYFKKIKLKNELLCQRRREDITNYVSDPKKNSQLLNSQPKFSSIRSLPNKITIGYTEYGIENGQIRKLFWLSHDRSAFKRYRFDITDDFNHNFRGR